MVRVDVCGKPVVWHGTVYRFDNDRVDLPIEQRSKIMYECPHQHETLEAALECAQGWFQDLVDKKISLESIGIMAERRNL